MWLSNKTGEEEVKWDLPRVYSHFDSETLGLAIDLRVQALQTTSQILLLMVRKQY